MGKRFLFTKNFYEKRAWQQGFIVCGLDEVGRGCLAGPLVVAAVMLFPDRKHRLLKDSKLLDQKESKTAYEWIIKNSWYSTCSISNIDIDSFNIWQSTLMAMRRASLNLFYSSSQVPSIILVDAMPLSLKNTAYENIEIQHFIEGERHSTSIAAASIVAKVTRDRLMESYDKIFPAYSLQKHKGYSTKLHQDSIKLVGHSIIHRLTYLKKLEFGMTVDEKQQPLLF